MSIRANLFAYALPLCLSACGIIYDDTSGESSEPETTAPATTETPGTTGEVESTGGTGTSEESAGSTTSPTTDPTTGESTTAPTTGEPTSTTDGSTTDGTTGGAVDQLPPIDSAEVLEAWLAEGAYKSWAGESKVHASTGPHGGNVRTYVNDALFQSLTQGLAMHPQDAATVKELYGDSMDTIIGYAVMVKVAPDSDGGNGWYWYERINQSVFADGTGIGLCTGCHAGGADYVLTPFPLQ